MMNKNLKACLILVVLLWTYCTTNAAMTIVGPSAICPNTTESYTLTGLASECSVTNWTANNINVHITPVGSSCMLDCSDIGAPGSFILTATVVCVSSPTVSYTNYVQMTVVVNGVGDVTISSPLVSFSCNPTPTAFTVTASSANANYFDWWINGSPVTSTHSNTLNVNRAGCSGAISIVCRANRSDCSTSVYLGKNGYKTITLITPTLPSSISGPSDLCTTAPANTATYSVTAGPNSCWTYNWVLSSGAPVVTMTNANTPNPTITVAAGSPEGTRRLYCTINACGRSVTLDKWLTFCNPSTIPADIRFEQLTTTCYYKFTALGGCGSTYQWQINGGPIRTSSSPDLFPIDPGTYTVKVRNVNGCGTSPWYTETMNLSPIVTDPPCMYKVSPAAGDDAQENVPGSDYLFNISPNPINNSQALHVTCSPELLGGRIEIYTMDGGKRFSGEVIQSDFDLSTMSLSNGLYMVRLTNGNINLMRKLLIVK